MFLVVYREIIRIVLCQELALIKCSWLFIER